MVSFANESSWVRFWHEPVRAERLAIVRIFLTVALLADQLLCYLPDFANWFGPGGIAPAGFHDDQMLSEWRLTILLFHTDDLSIVGCLFAVWMAVTFLYCIGWQTRVMAVLTWFLTICFINRVPVIKNYGDCVLCVSLFYLQFMPTGKALSLDRWLEKRRRMRLGQPLPEDWYRPMVPPWGVRLLQIQLCMLYLTTGLAKLRGGPEQVFDGTWWQGTSVYYVLNDVTMNRLSIVELPLPFWVTAVMTYTSLCWETLFPVLLLSRWTRKWTLWFGVAFHLGIYLLIEVGWFSFYTVSRYGVWIPDEFWDRWSSGPKQTQALSNSLKPTPDTP